VKLLISAGVVACASIALLTFATGQDMPSEQKHLTIAPLNGNRAVALTALSIERGVEYPSVIRLKGNVEIKTPVCLPVGKKSELICDGEMIVRADEAQFHEDTGEIQPIGHVTVMPLRHKPKI
jgi:hypothetical protein